MLDHCCSPASYDLTSDCTGHWCLPLPSSIHPYTTKRSLHPNCRPPPSPLKVLQERSVESSKKGHRVRLKLNGETKHGPYRGTVNEARTDPQGILRSSPPRGLHAGHTGAPRGAGTVPPIHVPSLGGGLQRRQQLCCGLSCANASCPLSCSATGRIRRELHKNGGLV